MSEGSEEDVVVAGDDDQDQEQHDDRNDDRHLFPTHPAFTIPVEIRLAPQYGKGQYGVFASEDIPPETNFWVWTDRVQKMHWTEVKDYIARHFGSNEKDIPRIQNFLRRGFVIPPPYDDYWNSNPTDAGTLMNHSSTPNCGRPKGTLRLVRKGEELTMDYSGNGNPQWYIDLCHSYGILTGVEIALEETKRGGAIQPAYLSPRMEQRGPATDPS
jgi:hypothetical protein